MAIGALRVSWHYERRPIFSIALPVEISFGLSEEIRHSKGSVSSLSPPHVRDNFAPLLVQDPDHVSSVVCD